MSDLQGLRSTYDDIESNAKSSQAAGVSSEVYESWLPPKVLQKIPDELRISLIRTLERTCNLGVLLKELKAELDIREQCFFAMNKNERELADKLLGNTPSIAPHAYHSYAQYSYYV